MPGIQGLFNIWKSITIHPINILKKKSHDYINQWIKSTWQNSIPIHDKNYEKNKTKGELPQFDKDHLQKTYSYHGEKLNAFSLTSQRRQKCTLLPLFFSTVLEVLASAVNQEKEIKGTQIRNEELKLSLLVHDMFVYIENPKESKETPRTRMWAQQVHKIQDKHRKINCTSIF